MKKVALIFLVAVLLPSLVLAWLAVRSLRDQQFLLERQQSLLCQSVTDALAETVVTSLARQQADFAAQVEALLDKSDPATLSGQFDGRLRQQWPMAEVGFCVTLSGKILSPSPNGRDESRKFYSDNGNFLGNREAIEVFNNQVAVNAPASPASDTTSRYNSSINWLGRGSSAGSQRQAAPQPASQAVQKAAIDNARPLDGDVAQAESSQPAQAQVPQASQSFRNVQQRKVVPQQNAYAQVLENVKDTAAEQNFSRLVAEESEFRQLVGGGMDGMFARFVQNKLRLMVWHRTSAQPGYVFGAQLDLNRVVESLRPLIQSERALQDDICLALLDDNARPVALSRNAFQASWKRPFVATEVGEALPHWEIAAYLVDPARLTQAAHTARLTLGLLVALLVFAIGVGSWLVVRSLNAELKLARQKTDFVSNVSHELKTPLTSIRMFSELLAEGRVSDHVKQRSYLNIITAEAARLTRLINNVLDFSRMERGEKKYNFQPCDLTEIVRGTAETFRPHLEAGGIKFAVELPDVNISIKGDADALSQVLVNLLSNAEKYSNGGKEISMLLIQRQTPLPHAEIRVMDRGTGVPRGCEEKIFEKFYRAHDSLSNGIQGSGLGLTIARQIARAHGGDIVCEPREGGGSCFILRLPISTTDAHR